MSDLDARVAALMKIFDTWFGLNNPAARAEMKQAIRAELQKPALYEAVKDRASIESSCRFIEQRIATRKCDHPAVSDCWRCNSVYLAKRMRDLLNTHPAPSQPATQVGPKLKRYIANDKVTSDEYWKGYAEGLAEDFDTLAAQYLALKNATLGKLPVVHVRKDQLQKAMTSPFLCLVGPHPRPDTEALVKLSDIQAAIAAGGAK